MTEKQGVLDKSGFQEQLAGLYLRLNGYFVSGFIVHVPEGVFSKDGEHVGSLTEVDILAVRFPFNSEPEREVEPSPYLQIPPGCVDVLICEVKGGKFKLQFNAGLRDITNPDCDGARTVLRWLGIVDEDGVEKILPNVRKLLVTQPLNTPDAFRECAVPGTNYRIRAVFFAPDRDLPTKNDPRYICGSEMLEFIWKCLKPEKPRDKCQTRYDFGLWGTYEKIVRCFKRAKEPFKTVEELYEAVEKTE